MGLLTASLLSLVFGFKPSDTIMSTIGALCFSGYIVFDTRRICEGNHPQHSLKSNQYVMGALALYMDIVNLFVQLLRLFGERER